MPAAQVMHKFKAGKLHSGSRSGPIVHNPKQAIAIEISEHENEIATGSADRPSRGKKPHRSRRG